MKALRIKDDQEVSTHSRPKAAGLDRIFKLLYLSNRFNTQPPEGGWTRLPAKTRNHTRFQHTAARRRLEP